MATTKHIASAYLSVPVIDATAAVSRSAAVERPVRLLEAEGFCQVVASAMARRLARPSMTEETLKVSASITTDAIESVRQLAVQSGPSINRMLVFAQEELLFRQRLLV